MEKLSPDGGDDASEKIFSDRIRHRSIFRSYFQRLKDERNSKKENRIRYRVSLSEISIDDRRTKINTD